MLDPSLEVFFVDVRATSNKVAVALDLLELFGWGATGDILNLLLFLSIFLLHLVDRFTLEFGSLILTVFQELFLTRLRLTALFVDLSLALELFFTLATQELLTLDRETDEGLFERFKVDRSVLSAEALVQGRGAPLGSYGSLGVGDGLQVGIVVLALLDRVTVRALQLISGY